MATPNSFANPNAVVSPTSNSSTKSSPSTNNGANVKISISFSLYQIFGLDLSLFFEFGFWFFFFFFWVAVQFDLENLRKDFNKINKQVAQLRIVSLLIFYLSFRVFGSYFFFYIRIHFISCFEMFVIFTNLKKTKLTDCVNRCDQFSNLSILMITDFKFK